MKTYKVGNWEASQSKSSVGYWYLMYSGHKKATYSPISDTALFQSVVINTNSLKDLDELINLIKKDCSYKSDTPKPYTTNTEDAIVELGQRVQSLELELSKLNYDNRNSR